MKSDAPTIAELDFGIAVAAGYPAIDLPHYIAGKRLEGRRLTVIDATNVRREDRTAYLRLAKQLHALPVAIVLNPGEAVCQARNAERPDRQFGRHVVRNHIRALERDIRNLQKEGFRQVHEFRSVEEMEGARMARQPLWTDRRGESGPFDIIGDVHRCCDELETPMRSMEDGSPGNDRRPPVRRLRAAISVWSSRSAAALSVLTSTPSNSKAGVW